MRVKILVLQALLATLVFSVGCENAKVTAVDEASKQADGDNQSEGVDEGNDSNDNSDNNSDSNSDDNANNGDSSGESPAQDACAPLVGRTEGARLAIGSGESFTKSTAIGLTLESNEASQMRISENLDCQCGNWEAFRSSKQFSLKPNQLNQISVQFKDYDGVPSKCVSGTILHDSLAPNLSVSLDAANTYLELDPVVAIISALDSGVGGTSVSCELNGANISCANNSLSIPNLQPGSYSLKVTAMDQLLNSTESLVSFTIKPKFLQKIQSVTIAANNKVDILMVIDNSGSMEYEQKSMAARMSSFISQLAGLDYRIGITTTDPSNATYGDGRLVALSGLSGQYIIDNSYSAMDAQTILGNTLQRSEVGSSQEQGIYATYRAIERAIAPTLNPNTGLFRPDANFATIVISDEDESASGFKNQPANLLSFISSTWQSKVFAFHSIIVRPGDEKCKSDNLTVFGTRYAQMTSLTGQGTVGGAILGNVCATDYGSQLSGIGQSVQQMQKVMDLDCDPLSTVQIKLNGSDFNQSYTLQGSRLVFASNLPLGNYELQYTCAAPAK